MPSGEFVQVLSNWINQAISPPGQLSQGQDPSKWVAERFVEWWRSRGSASALNDAESAMQAIRSEMERLGGWNNPQLGEAMHELVHLRDALVEIRIALGLTSDD